MPPPGRSALVPVHQQADNGRRGPPQDLPPA
eukprot:CAMPEP_0198473112 /NCGR_PEP_ID=MMETSP1456-20131121/33186_1 /TAXON_ID=1461544 ORGANISM="Unidentified sp., Strain RCC1871" /NCGR_SAMPLE_ID=MMETSP1456 /ASSEMBLY_ACC=CAM_ASM_001119 /LENGTH=30 /DNA_ID= /DNA_START= /DNA_END= /DNA_ORIENTATION=